MSSKPATVGLGEGVMIALDSIWANKLRSFLTVLGNVIAVTSIILVVTIIQGVNSEVTALFTAEGADVFTLRRTGLAFSPQEEQAQRSRPRLTRSDAAFLRERGTTLETIVEGADSGARIEFASRSIDRVSVEGRSWEWSLVDSTGLVAGRYFARTEAQRNRPVVLLGPDVVEELFPGLDPAAAIDKRVRLGDLHFTVIGVLDSRGSAFGFSRDEFAVIPLGTFQRMFGYRQSIEMQIRPTDPDRIEEATEETRMLMRMRHRLRPRDADDFTIASADTFLDLYNQFTAGIYGALVGIVAMALVVGGIVIMNIMLMVVTERTREIGVRKAVGATYQQVLWQFLVEAVTLSVFGGVSGIALGSAIAALIAAVSPLPYILELWSVTIALATVTLAGVVFGIYPASKAARLDPITALRYE